MESKGARGPGALPMAVGMIIGALSGFALWIVTDTFVFLPAFLGVGLALGLAFDAVRERD